VTIVGEAGAVIASQIPIAKATALGGPIPVKPVIHVRGVRGVVVENITFLPAEGLQNASAAIVIEGSPFSRIANNTITGFQFGVMLNCIVQPVSGEPECIQNSEHTDILGNRITGEDLWTGGPADPGFTTEYGIVSTNGQHVRLVANIVSHMYIAMWMNDKHGEASRNTVTNTLVGLILCHVYAGFFEISGITYGSETAAADWQVHDNTAVNNSWGILAIDGANHNHIANNALAGNSLYDIELAGETTRFAPIVPFLLPSSHDNFVVAGARKGIRVKDCGLNDRISGSVLLVDKVADPCF
jgi:hypothetical protein